ncbi:site-specific DNA-methyltransferase [Brachyspira pilosicoli]|uniref:Methyltransferase n=1 Tax=Brachyspira pilosicoli TaxID=52584 RepID=A0A5C8ENZ6_BRAPL|nr:site-specific DNA-methyltransferase [Brachyspira pilosicoli]TXJ39697.1 site-specific DNA-methyltransferase [Brachyspira pilosicoli]
MKNNFEEIRDKFIHLFGRPYYINEHGIIFCIDTLEALELINFKFINLIITSPPYNIGKEYENILPINEYVNWLIKWINKAYQLSLDNSSMLLNLGYINIDDIGRAIPIPYLIWDKIPYYLNQEIVWNYSAGVACKKYLSPRNEKILWYVKDRYNYTFNLDDIRDKNVKYPNSKKNGKVRVNTLGKNPSDVWEIAKVTTGLNRSSKERTEHPCQFPMDLLERAVLGFSNENDVVFDPFIGSGSTFEACIKFNRFCIGFEIQKKYCEIIKHRIKNIENNYNLVLS